MSSVEMYVENPMATLGRGKMEAAEKESNSSGRRELSVKSEEGEGAKDPQHTTPKATTLISTFTHRIPKIDPVISDSQESQTGGPKLASVKVRTSRKKVSTPATHTYGTRSRTPKVVPSVNPSPSPSPDRESTRPPTKPVKKQYKKRQFIGFGAREVKPPTEEQAARSLADKGRWERRQERIKEQMWGSKSGKAQA